MILIIGAGPIGCYAASLLAEEHEIIVVEEHSSVGLPVQCTGIVTSEILNFIPKNNKSIINRISKVRIISPNDSVLNLTFEKSDIILDRTLFDKYFYEKAKKKNVSFLFNHRFIKINKNKAIIKNIKSGKIKKIDFDYLIGADGSNSSVAKIINKTKRRFYPGMQAIIKKKNNNIIDFYPYKEGYGWAVPINKSSLRVGVLATSKTILLFNLLIKKYSGKIVEKQSGIIPIFNCKERLQKNNIFLIGDAATLVKTTTGGGLVSGLKSSELVARAIIKNKNYSRLIKKNIGKDLWTHNKIRKIMNKFSEKDWDELITDFDSRRLKQTLQKVNRDKIMKLLVKLSFLKPSLIRHVIRHFKKSS